MSSDFKYLRFILEALKLTFKKPESTQRYTK